MSGVLPTVANLEPTLAETEPRASFEKFVREITHRAANLWRQCPSSFWVPGVPVEKKTKRHNERAALRLFDELEKGVSDFPQAKDARRRWQSSLIGRVRGFSRTTRGFPPATQRLLMSDEFFECLLEFVRQAREFDPEIRIEDVYQALRNVWIGGSVQLLLEQPVIASPSLVAYSLLYPYTDNRLDDPQLSPRIKKQLSHRLELRLRGDPTSPLNEEQSPVFRLVAKIEEEYPRSQYPFVYESLLAIHRAQVQSLRQQHATPATDPDLLEITFEKGGTSVLADGYVIAGELPRDQAEFLFRYGILLQMLDDLQDVRRDLAAGHRTLFSSHRPAPLDPLVNRLLHFMDRVLQDVPFSGPERDATIDLISRNCLLLLQQSIALHPSYFSRRVRNRLEKNCLYRSSFFRRQRSSLRRRKRRIEVELKREKGLSNLWDVLT